MAALAVARYTLVELSRRRLLGVFVGIGIFLTAGIGIAPLVLPGFRSADDRTIFILGGISRVDGLALELCAFAIGMTVINHDLDSGAIVGILSKPVTRLSYSVGKLAAALFLLFLLGSILTAGSMLAVELNSGGHMEVLFWFFAAGVANMMLLMILVMDLTVYLNNIVAAAIVVTLTFVQNQVSVLYALVQQNVITTPIHEDVVRVFYWLVPHPLVSNLDRDITITQFNLNCATGCAGMQPDPAAYLAQELSRIPGATGNGDIVYWFAYLAVACGILYLALRRKQV